MRCFEVRHNMNLSSPADPAPPTSELGILEDRTDQRREMGDKDTLFLPSMLVFFWKSNLMSCDHIIVNIFVSLDADHCFHS